MKRILVFVVVCFLLIGVFSGCGSSDYPYGYEECFTCKGSGLVNTGFFNPKTCPTCKGSGMLDSH